MTILAITLDGKELGTREIADGNVPRIAAYAVAVRKGSIVEKPAVEEVRDEKGNVATEASPAVMRDPTPEEALSLLAGDFFDTLCQQATAKAKADAAEAAAAAVEPIA